MRFLRTWNKEQEAKEKGGELERRIDGVWIQFAIWVPRPRHLSHKRIGLIGVSPSIKMACLQLVNLYSLRSHPPSVVTVWPGQGCQPAWSYLILNLSNLSALLFFCVWIRPSAHHASALKPPYPTVWVKDPFAIRLMWPFVVQVMRKC